MKKLVNDKTVNTKLDAGEPVRRYIFSIVFQTPAQPIRIPSERDLALRFGISRVTVRNNLSLLEKNGILIRLTGRRGAFTNPGMASSLERSIGVFLHANIMSPMLLAVLSGFSAELRRRIVHSSFSFFFENNQDFEHVTAQILSVGCQILLFPITSAVKELQKIEILRNAGIIVIPFAEYIPENAAIPEGTFTFDHAEIGKSMAEFFLGKKCKKILYCSDDSRKYDCFRRTIEAGGGKCSRKLLPEELFQVEQKFPLWFCSEKPDGIVATGSDAFLHSLLQQCGKMALQQNILLGPHELAQSWEKEFAGLNLSFLDNVFFYKCLENVGRAMGIYAEARMGKKSQIPVYKEISYFHIKTRKRGRNQ